MHSRVSCVHLLTVGCCVGTLWYLSISRPESPSVPEEVDPPTNITFTDVLTLDLHAGEFVITESTKCDGVTPFLVILITTRPTEVDARQAIRETWGDVSVFADIRILRVFLLGRSTDSVLNKMVEQESPIFQDIVVGNFIDSYHNLTLKTMMGIRWVATFCPPAQYIMKTDSDVFVNMHNLIYELLKPAAEPRRRYYVGWVLNVEPIRDPLNKWYMPRDVYPDNKYPPFCSGTGYVFSADVAELIYETSRDTALLHLEDVYMGVCLRKLGIIPCHNSGFTISRMANSLSSYRLVITLHQISPQEMHLIWFDMTSKKHPKC